MFILIFMNICSINLYLQCLQDTLFPFFFTDYRLHFAFWEQLVVKMSKFNILVNIDFFQFLSSMHVNFDFE